jgi:hypothetical protein
LLSRTCGNLAAQSRVALVWNLATETHIRNGSEDELRRLGFAVKKTITVGGTIIEMQDR